jgi:hypothetical protein
MIFVAMDAWASFFMPARWGGFGIVNAVQTDNRVKE